MNKDEDIRKERARLSQQQRRKKLMRIDYSPRGDALAIIEAEKARLGKKFCVSELLDAAVVQWADARED